MAIAFYFKDADVQGSTASVEHDFLRGILAITVAISTVVIYWVRRDPSLALNSKVAALPLQWIALAFIVITFYFKERKPASTE